MIPVAILVVIIGTITRKPINTGTISVSNQIKPNKIIEITGVERTVTNRGLRKVSIVLFSPEAIPAT